MAFVIVIENLLEKLILSPVLITIPFKSGDQINFSNKFSMTITKAIHGYLPFMKDNEIKENIGFIIDDSANKIYITGDTISFNNDYKCDYLFMPFSNHGITTGIYDGLMFAKETGAKMIIPMNIEDKHYTTNVNELVETAEKLKINLHVMKANDVLEINEF